MDDTTRSAAEAGAFRQLVEHLRSRPEVSNLELMNLSGFCRNCLSKWYRASLESQGVLITDAEAREYVYGMPYVEWKAKYPR